LKTTAIVGFVCVFVLKILLFWNKINKIISILKTLFKNEFIVAPLKLGYCHDKDGKINEHHLNFYQQRAEYLGAIILKLFYLHPGLSVNFFSIRH
jgi:2,4-dienoyl-CoA reductase-like NADH-dependent reductase (Old Yellow Enzyme family)